MQRPIEGHGNHYQDLYQTVAMLDECYGQNVTIRDINHAIGRMVADPHVQTPETMRSRLIQLRNALINTQTDEFFQHYIHLKIACHARTLIDHQEVGLQSLREEYKLLPGYT